jgi:hypothetical protein
MTNCRDETEVTFASKREKFLIINRIELWPIKVHRRYFSMSNLISYKTNGHTVPSWTRVNTSKSKEMMLCRSDMKWTNFKCDDNVFCLEVSSMCVYLTSLLFCSFIWWQHRKQMKSPFNKIAHWLKRSHFFYTDC